MSRHIPRLGAIASLGAVARSGAITRGTAVLALLIACAAAGRPARPAGPLTLGTFDSRAVAVAYVGSAFCAAELATLKAEMEQAQAAGDTARAAALEAQAEARQEQLHRQGFSTAPVHDLLDRVRDRLPALAQEAGVDAIVSKWELVYTAPTASTVDVTERLVAAFEPNEQSLQWAREVVDHPPEPLDASFEHDEH
jgi:hypothetical protein